MGNFTAEEIQEQEARRLTDSHAELEHWDAREIEDTAYAVWLVPTENHASMGQLPQWLGGEGHDWRERRLFDTRVQAQIFAEQWRTDYVPKFIRVTRRVRKS